MAKPLVDGFSAKRIGSSRGQEGDIILGTGGDNSKGTFFEGVMVADLPSGATENPVQANVVSVGYSGETDVPNGPQGQITGPGGKCADVADDTTGVNGAAVRLWEYRPTCRSTCPRTLRLPETLSAQFSELMDRLNVSCREVEIERVQVWRHSSLNTPSAP